MQLRANCVLTAQFVLTADAAGCRYSRFLWTWPVWQILNCHTTISMALRLSPMLFIRRNSISNCLLFFPHTATLHVFISSNVFGRLYNRSSKIVVFCRVLACNSGPESESHKFYRLRLQPKPSTLTDSNFGLDFDSSGLVLAVLWSGWSKNHLRSNKKLAVTITFASGSRQNGHFRFPDCFYVIISMQNSSPASKLICRHDYYLRHSIYKP